MSVSSPALSLILSLYNVLKFINTFIYSSLMIMGGKIDVENRIHFLQLKQSSMLHFFSFCSNRLGLSHCYSAQPSLFHT